MRSGRSIVSLGVGRVALSRRFAYNKRNACMVMQKWRCVNISVNHLFLPILFPSRISNQVISKVTMWRGLGLSSFEISLKHQRNRRRKAARRAWIGGWVVLQNILERLWRDKMLLPIKPASPLFTMSRCIHIPRPTSCISKPSRELSVSLHYFEQHLQNSKASLLDWGPLDQTCGVWRPSYVHE